MRIQVRLSRGARRVLLGVSVVLGAFMLLALVALYNSPPA
jgi:hypothetical protein